MPSNYGHLCFFISWLILPLWDFSTISGFLVILTLVKPFPSDVCSVSLDVDDDESWRNNSRSLSFAFLLFFMFFLFACHSARTAKSTTLSRYQAQRFIIMEKVSVQGRLTFKIRALIFSICFLLALLCVCVLVCVSECVSARMLTNIYTHQRLYLKSIFCNVLFICLFNHSAHRVMGVATCLSYCLYLSNF